MADNLRSITELEVLTEVPDGTYTVVVDGGTAKLAPYGGGGAEAIEIVYTTADGVTVTCDKTYEEIYEALVTGNGVANVKIVVEGTLFSAGNWWSFAIGPMTESEYDYFIFSANIGTGIFMLYHNSNNEIEMSQLPWSA